VLMGAHIVCISCFWWPCGNKTRKVMKHWYIAFTQSLSWRWQKQNRTHG